MKYQDCPWNTLEGEEIPHSSRPTDHAFCLIASYYAKPRSCLKDDCPLVQLFAYVEHNADYADQLRIDLGDMIEQQAKDIERLYASRTKLLELEKEVEKLKTWEHKLDEISEELILEDVEELIERITKLEKKVQNNVDIYGLWKE